MTLVSKYLPQKSRKRFLSYDAIGIFLVSLGCVLFGLILFCVREKVNIEVSQAIEDEMQVLVKLANIDVAYQENNDKLVYLSGELKTPKKLVDPIFGISVQSCKLKREVSMYQWVVLAETKEVDVGDRVKNEVVYQFEKRWVSELVKLDYKGHRNPSSFPIPPLTLNAEAVYVGTFQLSGPLAGQIVNFRSLKLGQHSIQFLESGKVLTQKKLPKAYFHNGALYFSSDPENPKIGDVKVQFSFAGLSVSEDTAYGVAEHVSIVGRQKGKYIVKYNAQNGSAIELLRMGKIEPEELLLSHLMFDRVRVLSFRFFSAVSVFIGIALVSAIVPAIGRPRFVPVWLASLLGHNRVILHIGTTISVLVACRCIVALFIADAPQTHQSTHIVTLLASVGVILGITKQTKSLHAAPPPVTSGSLIAGQDGVLANGTDSVKK